jgi:tetratricopeptide (TPR) repeat protein
MYSIKGEYDQAIGEYTQAIALKPNDADAYINWGLAYYYKKDYAQARADWEKAVQLDPTMPRGITLNCCG